MARLTQIFDDPVLRRLQVLAGRPSESSVDHVVVAEAVTPPPDGAGAFLVLTGAASRELGDYHLDVLLRQAAMTGVGAILLTGDRRPRGVAPSAARIAERGNVAVLSTDMSLADVIVHAAAALAGDASAAIGLIQSAVEVLGPLGEPTTTPEQIAAEASSLLGTRVALSPDGSLPDGDHYTEPIPSPTQPKRSVYASAQSGHRATATQFALHLAAAAITRAEALREFREERPARSSAAAVTELLVGSTPSESLLAAARGLGIPVDAWHQVVRVEYREPTGATPSGDPDLVHRWEVLELGARLAEATARDDGHIWHAAQADGAVALVRSSRAEPGPGPDRSLEPTVRAVAARLQDLWAPAALRAAVGSARQGAPGLRASAAEARAALASHTSENAPEIIFFDAAGLGRLLREWYASDTAQRAVTEMLAPLERLPADRRGEAIQTLTVWLEEGGSTASTARRLYLHRNTVRYRIAKIERALGLDLTVPDTRLALLLACRARSIGHGTALR